MYRTIFLALLCAGLVNAQGPGLAGDWKGTLAAGAALLRLELHVNRTDDGLYLGQLNSLDQGSEIPLGKTTVEGKSVQMEFPLVSGSFNGELSADGNTLKGTWSQGVPLPLTLTRTAKPAAEAPKSAAAAERPKPLDVPIDAAVPFAPTPFLGAGGRTNLLYELRITNFSAAEQSLERIEVLGDSESLASFEGKELIGILMRPGFRESLPDDRKLGPGLSAVAYLFVPLAGGKAPDQLRHRITVSGARVATFPLPLSKEKPIVIGPPLRGSDWMAANGPGNTSGHRRAMIPIGGRAAIPQRYAIDWVQMKTANATYTGDAKNNKNYKAYGADLLAVADATVAAVKDGIPENVPGAESRAVPITLETIAGNHVILDLGGGRYCMYAHLQPGSLKVKQGDRVKRGQVLGLLGNSGNSTEPHLHFQVMNAPSPLGSEGLPYAIDAFELMNGQSPGKRQNALPMQNMLVKF